jgi:ribosomal protein S18 acetylase RimI-like enzyme
MSVILQKANREDMRELWQMQVDAFKGLLAKYHDDDMSPAAESYERILQKFDFTGTTYYFIVADGKRVGGIRIIDKKDGSRKRISPIWIMPEFRNLGFAQQAILEAERIYGEDNWSLDTILQEKGNLHLYEKLGYRQTGKIEKISDLMDIVYYEKN